VTVGVSTRHMHQGAIARDGTFTVPNPDGAQGTLFAQDRQGGRCAILKNVRGPEGPFTLRFRQGLSIQGRIEGYPAGSRSGWIYAYNELGLHLGGSVDVDGTFSFRALPEGTYTLTGSAADTHIEERHGVAAGARGVVLTLTPRKPK